MGLWDMIRLIIFAKPCVCEKVKLMKAEPLLGLHKILCVKSHLNS